MSGGTATWFTGYSRTGAADGTPQLVTRIYRRPANGSDSKMF
jgi:hypothetical protein